MASDSNAGPNDAYLILEDDVSFEETFMDRWAMLWSSALEKDYTWRALWLGLLDADMDLYGDMDIHGGIGIRNFNDVTRTFGAGAFAYVIRKKGAEDLMKAVESQGVQQAIDWFLFDRFGEMVSYYIHPPLVYAPAGLGRDSDVSSTDYPQARLLLHKQADQGMQFPPLRLSISSPIRGSSFVPGDVFQLLVFWETEEDSRLTLERHRDSRLCLRSSPLSVSDLGGGDKACYSTFLPIHFPILFNDTMTLGQGSIRIELEVMMIDINQNVVAAAETSFSLKVGSSNDGRHESLYEKARAYCTSTSALDLVEASQVRLCMLDAIERGILHHHHKR